MVSSESLPLCIRACSLSSEIRIITDVAVYYISNGIVWYHFKCNIFYDFIGHISKSKKYIHAAYRIWFTDLEFGYSHNIFYPLFHLEFL